jgi:GrpB-like predicted nucleotidyltransferase (UPF0157 family)
MFERERDAISANLSALGTLRVEHIGSTSIGAIRAKPIIDIMVGVSSYEPFEEYCVRFGALGYDYDVNALRDDPSRHVFRKGPADRDRPRTHHVHFTLLGCKYWVRILAFRDYLVANTDVAREYEKLKARLAVAYPGNVQSYTRGKSAFVRRIEETATLLLSERNVARP